jgi:predicted transcriptional regulator
LKKENVSIEDILRVISDNKALVLFNTIALTEGAPIQIRKIGLTTRQYYSRLSRLTKTGLVTRKNGRYFLTLLGKIVYEIRMSACKVLSYHWKLKILESIQMSAPKLPEE